MRFPLNFVPAESWHVSPRRFGANRSGGRKHAGCDLYAAVGTPVFAVGDGTVRGFSLFYQGTYALTVQHKDFLIRYGEIGRNIAESLAVGSQVTEGQQIGVVGDLEDLPLSMVHLEMYSGTGSGPLTVPANVPFKRRSDLIDPTTFLDSVSSGATANIPTKKPALRLGDKNDAVRDWQQRLLRRGYAMSVDGEFGAATETATKAFQEDADLMADGAVGADTYAAMAEAEKD